MLAVDADRTLLALLAELRRCDYRFVTPTPATHGRVVARQNKRVAADLRDVFGWSLPFAPGLLPGPMMAALEQANALEKAGGILRSAVRISNLGDRLFLHSAYPTDAEDAVFFGPDSYRFVDFVQSEMAGSSTSRLVDMGAGAGVGAIMAAACVPDARLTLLDRNRQALRLAAINAADAGLEVELVEGKSLDDVIGSIDLVIANPPFIMDKAKRGYRDGGDMHGARISLDWTLAAAKRLEPGGRMLLYTGVAIVDGRDALRETLERQLPMLGCTLRYREIDPDIFGEELEQPAYADVERIAAIGAVVDAAR